MNQKDEFLARYGDADNAAIGVVSKDDEVRFNATQNHMLPHNHMHNIMLDKDDYVGHLGLSLNHGLSSDYVDKLCTHSDCEVERNAHIHPNVSPENINKAINSRHIWPGTVDALIRHSPHITKEHLQTILGRKSHHTYDNKDLAQEKLMKDYGVDQ